MIHQAIELQIEYGKMGVKQDGYQPKLYTYLWENSPEMDAGRIRPAVVICPGGGYAGTSDREAEAVALQFMAAGFHAFVLRYSCYPSAYPAALLEAAKAVSLVRERAGKWHVDPDKIAIMGFSAGGHLAGSLGVFWKRTLLSEALGVSSNLIRPNGMILCYPVITSGEFAHQGSFQNLLQDRYEELAEEMSLEKQVSKDTPPAFLWHTYADDGVPVENTMLMASALRKQGVPFELHIYPRGGHGLSLANEETKSANGFGVQPECQTWIELVKTWLKNL